VFHNFGLFLPPNLYVMNVLVLGSGGREHALSHKISQSNRCEKLFIAPGNAGTASLGENELLLLVQKRH